jgi:hypothetical protein
MTKLYNVGSAVATWRKLALGALLTVAGLTTAQAQCTPPIIATFPYLENFDGVAAGTLPCGITVANTNGDAETWSVAAAGTDAASAPNVMVYFYNDDSTTPANDWFFTPAIAMRAGYRYSLRFKYRALDSTYPEKMEVKYGTAATVAGQTTTLWSNTNITNETYVTTTNGTGAGQVSFITPTTTGTYYIGFHAMSDPDEYALLVDDLQVTEESTACLSPTALAVGGITATGASVSFTGTSSTYSVIYGPKGFNPATSGTTVSGASSPIGLTNLTAATNYDVYVRGTCGTLQSTLAGPISFTTLCGSTIVATFPYAENFDNVATGVLPCGFTVLNANNDAETWQSRSTVPTAAGQTPVSSTAPNAMVYFYNENGTTAANDWFFTAPIAMQTGYSYQLSFKYRNSGTNYPEKLEVKYGNAATVAGQTTTLWNNAAVGTSTFATADAASTPRVLAITPAASGSYYIGFHVYSAADQFFLAVDDVQVTRTQITGTQSAELARAISVYPNPSTGRFTLDVTGTAAKAATLRVEVSNALGQSVYTGSVKNAAGNQLDLSKLSQGIYNLKVLDGDQFTMRRLVIE